MPSFDVFPIDDPHRYTSGFRTADRPTHNGVDLACIEGTLVRAPFAGVVTMGFERGGAGQWIWVTHDDGTRFKCFHLRGYVAAFAADRRVAAGELIAYTGGAAGAWYSGSSTGPHAHIEVHLDHRDPNPVDPRPYLDAAEGHTQPTPPPPPEDDDMPRYTDWQDEDRWALARDVAGVIAGEDLSHKERPDVTTDDIGHALFAIAGLIGQLAKGLGVTVSVNQPEGG